MQYNIFTANNKILLTAVNVKNRYLQQLMK